MGRKMKKSGISKREFRKICGYAVHYEFCVCYLCGLPITDGQKWNLDHIKPKSRGGKSTPENLRPVHADCNQAKSDLSLAQFRKIQQIGQNLKQRGK